MAESGMTVLTYKDILVPCAKTFAAMLVEGYVVVLHNGQHYCNYDRSKPETLELLHEDAQAIIREAEARSETLTELKWVERLDDRNLVMGRDYYILYSKNQPCHVVPVDGGSIQAIKDAYQLANTLNIWALCEGI